MGLLNGRKADIEGMRKGETGIALAENDIPVAPRVLRRDDLLNLSHGCHSGTPKLSFSACFFETPLKNARQGATDLVQCVDLDPRIST